MVSPEYTADTSRFCCEVNWLELDVDEAAQDAGYLVLPEERFRVAMIR